jgi:hypothetical protein
MNVQVLAPTEPTEGGREGGAVLTFFLNFPLIFTDEPKVTVQSKMPPNARVVILQTAGVL